MFLQRKKKSNLSARGTLTHRQGFMILVRRDLHMIFKCIYRVEFATLNSTINAKKVKHFKECTLFMT